MKTLGSCFTLLALFAFGSAPLGATTPAFIQGTVNQISSGITNSVPLSSPTAAGSLIVVYVIWDNTGSVSVSDSAGNTYASAVGPTQWNSDPYSVQVFYAINRSGGADAVTATFSTAVMSFGIVYVHEYSGVDQTAPIDVTAAASGSSPSLDSGFATTTSANDLIFGAGVSDNIVTAEGFGFTVRDLAFGNITEDLIGSSPGPYAATATHQGKMWAMQMVAFRAASGSSDSDTPSPTVPDTQAPTVSITSPSNNQTISGTVTITADAADNIGVVGVQFELDGATLGIESTTAPYSTILNTIQAGNGSHLLTAVARDAAGNTTTSSGVIVTVNKVSLRPYTTNFPLNENPISEGGNWINGHTVGLDWADISTSSGLAMGTQSGFGGYDDSTALLTGVWGPDQTAEATVRTTNQNSGAYEEVEIRLRSSISAHSNTGYEINFRCLATGDTYSQIVRWNGPLGDFTHLNSSAGPGLNDGDVVKATVIGNVITAYINGRAIVSVTDDTFSGGNPGMGFYVQGAIGVNQDYGFTSFSASDGSTPDNTPPSTPANLSAIAIASSRIDLSWTPSTDDVGVAGYLVFRDNNQIASTTITRISDTGLSAITQYAYTVFAFDAAGNVSTQSAQVIATTLAPDTTAPPVPVDLQSSNITSSSLIVAWSEPAGDVAVARYQVFRDGIQVATTTATSYADSGLAPLTTYAYTIAAYGYAGIGSVQSQQLLVTTTAAPLTPPSLVQVTHNQIVSGTGVSVGFNTPSQSGNTIVAYVIWDNAGSVVLTDSGGDVFVSVGGPTTWGNGYSAQVFYASNIAGGVDTVTAAFRNSVASFGVVYIHEYAGISAFDPVDVTAAASGSSASLNSGLATTTSANDLIFGAGVSDNFVTAAGSDFTPRDLAYGNITEDRSASSPGPYAATAIHNGKMWGMQMVAFRAAN
jgi:chitodextrinase